MFSPLKPHPGQTVVSQPTAMSSLQTHGVAPTVRAALANQARVALQGSGPAPQSVGSGRLQGIGSPVQWSPRQERLQSTGSTSSSIGRGSSSRSGSFKIASPLQQPAQSSPISRVPSLGLSGTSPIRPSATNGVQTTEHRNSLAKQDSVIDSRRTTEEVDFTPTSSMWSREDVARRPTRAFNEYHTLVNPQDVRAAGDVIVDASDSATSIKDKIAAASSTSTPDSASTRPMSHLVGPGLQAAESEPPRPSLQRPGSGSELPSSRASLQRPASGSELPSSHPRFSGEHDGDHVPDGDADAESTKTNSLSTAQDPDSSRTASPPRAQPAWQQVGLELRLENEELRVCLRLAEHSEAAHIGRIKEESESLRRENEDLRKGLRSAEMQGMLTARSREATTELQRRAIETLAKLEHVEATEAELEAAISRCQNNHRDEAEELRTELGQARQTEATAAAVHEAQVLALQREGLQLALRLGRSAGHGSAVEARGQAEMSRFLGEQDQFRAELFLNEDEAGKLREQHHLLERNVTGLQELVEAAPQEKVMIRRREELVRLQAEAEQLQGQLVSSRSRCEELQDLLARRRLKSQSSQKKVQQQEYVYKQCQSPLGDASLHLMAAQTELEDLQEIFATVDRRRLELEESLRVSQVEMQTHNQRLESLAAFERMLAGTRAEIEEVHEALLESQQKRKAIEEEEIRLLDAAQQDNGGLCQLVKELGECRLHVARLEAAMPQWVRTNARNQKGLP
eukprot:gnl/MRDRNA2_/MRDRNA2_98216_c0_seq1.p1 gnl/MRDRNA2_/MRDRNA2_98216_c0~~gnl/MRDRNA2_/MRDRNA2_98216_c0_seq1.p1  ORF type:complete len:742 (+),score=166.82 gnl/MRDRNA2_/MRDRNA2_98216_c0_seq1:72-2297(+)